MIILDSIVKFAWITLLLKYCEVNPRADYVFDFVLGCQALLPYGLYEVFVELEKRKEIVAHCY